MRVLERVDTFQRERPWLAFPLAVVKKFGEDRGGRLAGLIAFFGFFALFPLLLVAVTVLGFILRDPDTRERIVSSALADFPIIGDQIQASVGMLDGSVIALVVGLLAALWAGLGGVGAVQDAMNAVWGVKPHERLHRLRRIARALTILASIGALTVVATGLSSIGGSGAAVPWRVLSNVGALSVDITIFLLTFRLLTARKVSWADVLPGAIVAGFAWVALQAGGTYLVQNRLRGASDTYGLFALVIGLLWWMLLSAQVMLYAAEVNVVRRERLWPRSLFGDPKTEADHRRRRAMGMPPVDVDEADDAPPAQSAGGSAGLA